jgi:urease accessory protein
MAVEANTSPGGWQAALRLGFRARPRRTILAERTHVGPLAVQRPFYPEGDVCHVYLLHPPGGVVGGDRLQIDVAAERNARALVTTPGATKFYRSAGDEACQSQTLVVADGASLEWLPQENIFFPGARARTATRIDLHGSARFAYWETQCLGRPAVGEVFDEGYIDSRLSVYRNDCPLIDERLRVSAANRQRSALMAGRPVAGILLMNGAGLADVEVCRGLLPTGDIDFTGVTLLDDILAVRYLGDSTERARELFTAIWRAMRPRLLGRSPNAPRIWAT